MTHTFDSEVSLHSWLLWPTVRQAVLFDSINFSMMCSLHTTISRDFFSKFKYFDFRLLLLLLLFFSFDAKNELTRAEQQT